MPYPNFIIGGPPKCGTTSLFAWLSDHPDVCVSSVKEPYFFQPHDDKEFSEDQLAAYSHFFAHHQGEKIVMEATPSNIYSASARTTLKRVCPDLKALFILRHPADRLYSEYAFHRFKTKKFVGSFSDFVTNERMIESDYTLHIDEWNATFGMSNIALVSFDDLTNRPQELMNALCNFLEIDAAYFENYSFDLKNKTVVLRNRGLHMWLLKWAKKLPLKWVTRISPIYYKMNSEATPPVTEIDKIELDRLRKLFDQTLPDILTKYSSQFIL